MGVKDNFRKQMAEHINEGDKLKLTTSYGVFSGTVHKLDKRPNADFSLKLINVTDVDAPEPFIPSHRFWKWEIKNIEIVSRVKTSPEKIAKQQWTTDNDI